MRPIGCAGVLEADMTTRSNSKHVVWIDGLPRAIVNMATKLVEDHELLHEVKALFTGTEIRRIDICRRLDSASASLVDRLEDLFQDFAHECRVAKLADTTFEALADLVCWYKLEDDESDSEDASEEE